jgi:uncharacterized protein with PIN domain
MPATKKPAAPVLACRRCGSRDVEVTSSQQMRGKVGQRRLHADVVCDNCGHSWWSVARNALKQARQLDRDRSGKAA